MEVVRTLEKQFRFIKEDLDIRKGLNTVNSGNKDSIDRTILLNETKLPSVYPRVGKMLAQGIDESTIKKTLLNEGYSHRSVVMAILRLGLIDKD